MEKTDSFDKDLAVLGDIKSQVRQLNSPESSASAGEKLQKNLNISTFEKASDLIADKAKGAVQWLKKNSASAKTFSAVMVAVVVAMSPLGVDLGKTNTGDNDQVSISEKLTLANAFGFASVSDLSDELNRVNLNESYGLNLKVRDEIYGSYHITKANGDSEITLGVVDTIITKAFSPTSFLNVSNETTSRFVAYHEMGHAVLNKVIKERGILSNLRGDVDGIDELNKAFNKVITNSDHMMDVYHEAFSDALGALNMIRNSNNTELEIRGVVESRAKQAHNQQHFAGGAFGDIAHRTDFANEAVLGLNFEKVREMSSEQTIDLAKTIATELTIKKFSVAFDKIIDRTAELGNISSEQQEFLKEITNPDNKIIIKGVSAENAPKESASLNDVSDFCDEIVKLRGISSKGLRPFETGLNGSEVFMAKKDTIDRLIEKATQNTPQNSYSSATLG